MPNELPIPDEFQHLIEKRETNDRRRAEIQEQEHEQELQTDASSVVDISDESTDSPAEKQLIPEKRRHDRRQKSRRKDER